MSIHFAQGKLQGVERTSILQEVQTQAKAAALRAIKPVLSAFLEEELTAKLGRGKRDPRRVSGQPRLINWQCGSCGCRDANQFTRDGHYRRSLETGWGEVQDLQIPMLECQQCQHDWWPIGRSSRNSSAFGWIWIKTCSLAVAYAKVCAIR